LYGKIYCPGATARISGRGGGEEERVESGKGDLIRGDVGGYKGRGNRLYPMMLVK